MLIDHEGMKTCEDRDAPRCCLKPANPSTRKPRERAQVLIPAVVPIIREERRPSSPRLSALTLSGED
jgi:hypothetical protein